MKKTFSTFLKYYLPPILWAGFIFFLSSQSSLPGFDVSLYDFIFKKSSHIFVFAVLYWLLYRAINFDTTVKKRSWILPLMICFLYAALDEFHQSFTATRTPTFRDIGFDMLGATISVLRINELI